MTYEYAAKGGSDWSEKVPTAHGDYTVRATVAETANYLGGTATADFTIAPAEATLTFDLAGGTLDGKTGKVTMSANVGDTVKLPGAPTRPGYTFQYWKGSQYAAGAKYKVEGDHDFTAEWKKSSGSSSRSGSSATSSRSRALSRTGDPTSLAAVAAAAASGVVALAGGAALRARTRRRGKRLWR